MKVIFLDFDGVLNCSPSFKRDQDSLSIWEPCMDALGWLVAESGAKVVVSSTWRYLFPLDELTMLLWAYGVDCEVIGRTPAKMSSPPRGQEIQWWVDDHPEVEGIVILDDEDDMEHLMPWLVQTEFERGLTMDDAAEALRVLWLPGPK